MVEGERKRRGTTLIELLVVMTIFSGLMTLILSFYIYAYHVSGSRDRLSVSYRKMITMMDKVETMLGNARVIYASSNELVFTPANASQPLLTGGWPNWMQPSTLAVMPQPRGAKGSTELVLHASVSGGGFKDGIVGLLEPGESVSFGNGPSASGVGAPPSLGLPTTPVTGVSSSGPLVTDSVVMTMTVQVAPENGVGVLRHYTLSRSILLEHP